MSAPSPSVERRERLVGIVRGADGPLTGADLGRQLGVSRQVIVNDIAIVRASGVPILGSPRGYVLTGDAEDRPLAEIACRHDRLGSRRELEILVDRGLAVVDVVVEHPLYGQVTADLSVRSRADIDRAMELLEGDDAQPLSVLTGGVHVHHVRAPSADALDAAERELADAGILMTGDRAG
jgi:transcriptional regulator of NAD metabolism